MIESMLHQRFVAHKHSQHLVPFLIRHRPRYRPLQHSPKNTLFEFSKKGATCATDHDMASLGVSSTKVSVPNRKKEWDVSILCGAESPAQPARSNSTKARMHREPDICLVHHT